MSHVIFPSHRQKSAFIMLSHTTPPLERSSEYRIESRADPAIVSGIILIYCAVFSLMDTSAGQSEREQLWWCLCCCHSPSLILHPAVWSVNSLDSLHMVLKSRKHSDVCSVVSSCHGYRNSLYILEQSFQAALQKYHFLSVVLYKYLYKHAL